MRDGTRALVVSDNVVLREGLRHHLEASGCSADLAGDVQGAVEVVERESRAGRPIHVVLIDNEGVRQGPREVADQFSGREGSREARLVLVHQMGRRADATQALQEGYTAALRKPPRRTSLFSTLDRSLRGATSGTSTRSEPAPEEAPRKRAARPVRSERILLVDDTEANREIASRMLGRAGFRVDAVASGEAALESVRSGSYDLVLMDIQMPGMTGFEATSAIRALEGPPSRVPVVAMTANAADELGQDLEEAGFDAFIGKPIVKKAMLETVDQLLARKGEAASAEPTPAPPGEDVLDSEILHAFRESVGTDAFPDLLDTFLQEIRRQVTAIRADAGEGRLEEVERNAHNVKGCAGTVGATALQKTAEALEHASRNRESEAAQRLAQELGTVADTALQALANFRSQLRPGS
jgi:CheY-like chemotaxis protein/HPt (histidine-containing phosphotransfer) domain-containing protein